MKFRDHTNLIPGNNRDYGLKALFGAIGDIRHHAKQAPNTEELFQQNPIWTNSDRTLLYAILKSLELPWYLGCADVFGLSFPDKIYNVGRWPKKIGEYMSLAHPAVSNSFGDVKPFFESYDIGLLDAWDPVDFAEKIITII